MGEKKGTGREKKDSRESKGNKNVVFNRNKDKSIFPFARC